MKIFIDSAKLNEIEEAYTFGVLDGVTTNPSLIRQAVENQTGPIEDYIKKILKTARGTPVSLEVTDYTAEKMIEQGRKLYKRFNSVADNVYIKVPVSPSFEDNDGLAFDGLKAIKTLSDEGIPVNATLIFSPEQAWLAAKAGAKFVSPFVGRIDDNIKKKHNIKGSKTDYFPAEGVEKSGKVIEENGIFSGIDLIQQTVDLFSTHGIEAEVLSASIRNVRQVRESALAGAQIATIPLGVIKDLVAHPQTMSGMKGFTNDVVPDYAELAR